MADFEEGLVTELQTITGLNNKVYPAKAPQDTAAPYLVYELFQSGYAEELDVGHSGMNESYYEFNFYASSFSALNTLKKAIFSKIKTWNFKNIGTTGPYIQQASIMDYSYGYDAKTEQFVGVIDLQVNYTE